MTRHFLVATSLLACLAMPAHSAHAAESYDNCTGYIDALPATISSGGTWCLRKDLATSIASGSAIDIATDGVTIDCNDFKIGGLAAGDDSDAVGINAIPPQYVYRRDIAVRHCNIRGFSTGIYLQNGIGQLIEDNRLDNNLVAGIVIRGGSGNRIRRNAVYDTGGHKQRGTAGMNVTGIEGMADITDNIIDGFLYSGDYSDIAGINAGGSGVRVVGNRIGGLIHANGGETYGITTSPYGKNVAVSGNRISASATVANGSGFGILGGYCSGNTIASFTIAMNSCADDGGNAGL
jgi:parallel beta-helix repeat protein